MNIPAILRRDSHRHEGSRGGYHALICVLLAALALLVFWSDLFPFLRTGHAWQAIFHPDDADFDQILFHFSTLPRILMAFLCGGGLALAGAAIQTALRNPLAAPTTLGVGAGVEFALTVFLLLAPASLTWLREGAALAGGMIALGAVYLIAARRNNSTLWLILAGMIVNLLLLAGSRVFLLFNQQYLESVFMWGAGNLTQNGWDSTLFVAPRLLIAGIALIALARPLDLLALGDETAGSLGGRVTALRIAILTLSVFVTATIISSVGFIGFVGLAVPAALRMAGMTRARPLMITAFFVGALGLICVDFLLRHYNGVGNDVLPTGAATALIGAPFIILVLRRARLSPGQMDADNPAEAAPTGSRTKLAIGLFVLLCVGLVASLFISLDQQGHFVLSGFASLEDLIDQRAGRTLAAVVCGIALAVSGTLIQRVGNNPMASPEITGVSSATALAMILALVFLHTSGRSELMVIGAIGGVVSLFVLLFLCRNFNHAPHYLLLNGLALTAILDSIVRIALTRSGPQTGILMSWLAGTTYFSRLNEVLIVAVVTAILGGITLLVRRPLELVSLGNIQAVSLGLHMSLFRLVMMLIAAILAAVSTLLIGPLSFIGLMAPHLARIAGFRLAGSHLVGAILIGANVMMVAEWLARNLMYPQELPTGLVAALIGTGYFLVLSSRRA